MTCGAISNQQHGASSKLLHSSPLAHDLMWVDCCRDIFINLWV